MLKHLTKWTRSKIEMEGKQDMSYNWYVCYEEAERQIWFYLREKKLGKEGRSITQHLPPLKGPRIPSRSLMLIWCQGVNSGLKFHLKFVTSDLSTCNYEQWNWLSPTFYQIHPYCVLLKKTAWPYRTNWSWVISMYYLHCCRCEVGKRTKWRGPACGGQRWHKAVSVKCVSSSQKVWNFCC